MWINGSSKTSFYYSVIGVEPSCEGLDALRMIFPEPIANEMNFVLFSTSGVHGSYTTIEEAEDALQEGQTEEITFLIVHPRIVTLRYGVCHPRTQEDIDYLKQLRASSFTAVAEIGKGPQE